MLCGTAVVGGRPVGVIWAVSPRWVHRIPQPRSEIEFFAGPLEPGQRFGRPWAGRFVRNPWLASSALWDLRPLMMIPPSQLPARAVDIAASASS